MCLATAAAETERTSSQREVLAKVETGGCSG